MTLEGLPDRIYQEIAALGHALGDPTRLRVLNLLCQVERSVDDLAARIGHSAANTSAHLKTLQRAQLVTRRKEGRRVFYRIASPQALRLWLAMRDVGLSELPGAREDMMTFANEPALLPGLWGEALLAQIEAGEVTLLDLRPREEFAAGHIPRARSIPLAELSRRLEELDRDRRLTAYCRGPYCVAAIKGVEQLRAAGFDAWRLPGGVVDWLGEGLELQTASDEHT